MSAVLTSCATPVEPGVAFELDGQPVTAHAGETILKAAQRHGVDIPHLCYSDGLRPDGNCRACVVEIAGERTLAPSCCRAPTEGMKVQAASPRARKSQQMVVEMLLSDMPDVGYQWNDDQSDTPELIAGSALQVSAKASFDAKCERCWHYRDDVGHDAAHPTLCGRCTSNLYGAGENRACA